MLALTRRIGEEIVIGDPSNPLGIIRVVDIHGDKVRLAFDFPKHTEINRRELAVEKAKQKAGGAAGAPPSVQPAGTAAPGGPVAPETAPVPRASSPSPAIPASAKPGD